MAGDKELKPSQPVQRQQTISSFFSPKSQPAPPDASQPRPLLPQQRPADGDDSTSVPELVHGAQNNLHPAVESGQEPPLRSHGDVSCSRNDQLRHATKRRRLDASDSNRSISDQALEQSSSAMPLVPSATRDTDVALKGSPSRFLFTPGPSFEVSNNDNEDDNETSRMKERLHQQFVSRLGDPERFDAIRRKYPSIDDSILDNLGDTGVDRNGDDHDDNDEFSSAQAVGRGARKRSSTKHKLTPMERQIVDIKKAHKDTVVVVEVGYKFRFFGHDARTAAKELGIVCIPGKMDVDEHFAPGEDRFASASIPTHRLHVHVRRLVAAGHKVGIVRQLETAALKAVGDNRNAPFVRKLTNLYTKGTYIDDTEGSEADDQLPSSPRSGHILCLAEMNAKGWGTDEKVHIGFVAVQPSTGDIIYDDFEDGFLRAELETRLLHVAPCEFLIVGTLSRSTERLIRHLSTSKANIFGNMARVERVDKPKTAAAQSFAHITSFYTAKPKSPRSALDGRAFLERIHQLSEQTSICLSSLITHLSAYGLEHVFHLTKNFQSFFTRSHMLLNATTLTSLEIYRNQTDFSEKGSLCWVLDHTITRPGQRLLRRWVGRPLLVREELQERIDAVEELIQASKAPEVEKLRILLSSTKGDLEKSLIRVYYGKCTRSELLSVLQALQKIAMEYAHVKSPTDAGFQSSLISQALTFLPLILDGVQQKLDRIDTQAARDNDKRTFFREKYASDDMKNHKMGIMVVENDIDAHRSEIAMELGRKSVEYVTVGGIDFLVEVNNEALRAVPASWTKISGTKKISRFHTPHIVRLIRQRDQHLESFDAACDTAFETLLSQIAEEYQVYRDCVQSIAVLDCLLSLATVSGRADYCKPLLTDGIEIEVEAGRHPMVEQLLLEGYVSNDVSLSSESTRALLITGPNMGGKSSYVRQVALISIMGQIGCHVPAASARLGMLDAIFTRMGAFDNMLAGESTFMVELNETSEILRQAGPRSLIILDELGRGTSTHDGVAIAHAVLEYILSTSKSLLLFITHYQSLGLLSSERTLGELKNMHMRFTETSLQTDKTFNKISFMYELSEGTSHRSYGLNVAQLADLPYDILIQAQSKSRKVETKTLISKIKQLLVNVSKS